MFPIRGACLYNPPPMSQYPSPYSPPPYQQNPGYFAPHLYSLDPLRAAKRAGLLMILVGAVAVLFSLCMVGVGQMIRTTPLPPELTAKMQEMEANGISPTGTFLAMGAAFFIFACAEIILGIIVRSGKQAAIVLSLIGTAIVLALFGFLLLGVALSALSHMAPQAIAGLMIWLVPFGLMILQLIWLLAAKRARPNVVLAQQQYQAQYWQYQQNMQAYGYGQQLPPPPKPPEQNAER
jgi:hypothetical protein